MILVVNLYRSWGSLGLLEDGAEEVHPKISHGHVLVRKVEDVAVVMRSLLLLPKKKKIKDRPIVHSIAVARAIEANHAASHKLSDGRRVG